MGFLRTLAVLYGYSLVGGALVALAMEFGPPALVFAAFVVAVALTAGALILHDRKGHFDG